MKTVVYVKIGPVSKWHHLTFETREEALAWIECIARWPKTIFRVVIKAAKIEEAQ